MYRATEVWAMLEDPQGQLSLRSKVRGYQWGQFNGLLKKILHPIPPKSEKSLKR